MDTGLPGSQASSLPSLPGTARSEAVDLIRGVAVCGILVMNIVSFAMPAAAYMNPNAYLDDRLSTHWVYGLTHVLADQKFMGLFSLLFGSSVMLFITKLRSRGFRSAPFYYVRTFWLMVFGFLHSFYLWEGDILFYYALCGFALYPFWHLPPRFQCTLGLAVFLLAIAFDQMGQAALEKMPEFALSNLEPTWSPSTRDIFFETSVRLSGYSEQLSYRTALPDTFSDPALDLVSDVYVKQGLARAFGLMLIGMAFYSWGIVTGERSRRFYRRMALWGFVIGLPLVSFGLWRHYIHHWDIRYGLFDGLIYNHLATPPLVFAYVGAIVSLQLSGGLRILRRGLSAVGRMAFSNYIGQSLICTFIFYGYGLALFGQLDRLQLFAVVLAVWLFQFYFSLLWLRYFRFGPLEWLWRGLTYFRLPPLRASGNPGIS